MANDQTSEYLLREFDYLSHAFWQNEELGERRVTWFFTLAGLLGTIIGLVISDRGLDEALAPTSLAVVVLLLFGRITFVRLIKRNLDTDGYKEGMAMARAWFVEQDPRIEPYLYFRPRRFTKIRHVSARNLGNGGWLETVIVANSLLGGMAAGFILLLFPAPLINPPSVLWMLAVTIAVTGALLYGAWQAHDARNRYRNMRRDVLRRTAGPLKSVPDCGSRDLNNPSEYFRAGVGAVIVNRAGKVLSLERSDVDSAWQLPQGGLEEGEEPEDAVYREVREETGLERKHLSLVGELPEIIAYELPPAARSPKTGRGQVQHWFYFLLTTPDDRIRLREGGEFQRWRWEDFGRLIAESVDFRRHVYARLEQYYAEVLDPLQSGSD